MSMVSKYWLRCLLVEVLQCQRRKPGAVWYDDSLIGQFSDAPCSSIAANYSTESKTQVYYQEVETGDIRELIRRVATRSTFLCL